MIEELVGLNPYPNDFVFFGSRSDEPIGKKSIERAFVKTVHEIGISEEERMVRGLTFHAWRHFADAMMHGQGSRTVRRVLDLATGVGTMIDLLLDTLPGGAKPVEVVCVDMNAGALELAAGHLKRRVRNLRLVHLVDSRSGI